PDGMIDGAEGTGIEAVKTALSEEQECLFFVALSRARDRLYLYSPTKSKDGRKRNRSPFIDRVESRISTRHVVPKIKLPRNAEDAPVPLHIDGSFAFTDHQLGLYQR